MKLCGMAGGQCPRMATMTVRIPGVGDRNVCPECHASMVRMGMEFRVLEPNAFVPRWRSHDLARDMTGRVLA